MQVNSSSTAFPRPIFLTACSAQTEPPEPFPNLVRLHCYWDDPNPARSPRNNTGQPGAYPMLPPKKRDCLV